MDGHSQSLAWLYKACHEEMAGAAVQKQILPRDYCYSHILSIETVRLEPEYRGYGIGLLAVDGSLKHAAETVPGWREEGFVVLDPAYMTRDGLPPGTTCEKAKERLTQRWGMLGLKVLVPETNGYCAFLQHYMGYERRRIETVVPHMLP